MSINIEHLKKNKMLGIDVLSGEDNATTICLIFSSAPPQIQQLYQMWYFTDLMYSKVSYANNTEE